MIIVKNYDNLKFFVQSSGQITNFSEIKNYLAFLDDIRENMILVKQSQYRQEEFKKFIKQIRIGKSEKLKNAS